MSEVFGAAPRGKKAVYVYCCNGYGDAGQDASGVPRVLGETGEALVAAPGGCVRKWVR